jgi:hypothetical protein
VRAAARDRFRTLHRPRAGTLMALGKEHLPIGEAVGFQAHRNNERAFFLASFAAIGHNSVSLEDISGGDKPWAGSTFY